MAKKLKRGVLCKPSKAKVRSKAETAKRESGTSRGSAQAGASEGQGAKAPLGAPKKPFRLRSEVQHQASVVVSKLLRARATGRHGGSIKGLCLDKHVKHKRAVFAVVSETVRYAAVLTKVAAASGVTSIQPQLTEGGLLVLLFDHLLGQGVRPHGRLERTFLAHATAIQAAVADLTQRAGATPLSALAPNLPSPSKPCTLHVNRLHPDLCEGEQITDDAAITKIQRLLSCPPCSWPPAHQRPLQATPDTMLPGVMRVELCADSAAGPPGGCVTMDLHDHPLVRAGCVTLQGRSSCMPVAALDPGAGWEVLDCCAAPGNKTLQAACAVGPQGRVHAVERDTGRCQTLRQAVARSKLTNVEVHEKDVLTLDSNAAEFRHVRGAIVDPSCSGSGTHAATVDALLDAQLHALTAENEVNSSSVAGNGADCSCAAVRCSSRDAGRVASLAAFQCRVLLHALSFPAMRRVVYSTCSVHREENEDVIAHVLGDARRLGFELVEALPRWPRRGLADAGSWSQFVVRVDPVKDQTDGFFVAVFERQLGA